MSNLKEFIDPIDSDDENFGNLDDVTMLEDRLYEKYKKDGYQAGCQDGFDEGKKMGFAKGGELSMEIGYYYGSCAIWLALIEKHPDKINIRARNTAVAIQKLIDIFSAKAENEDLFKDLGRIRARFKQFTAQVKSNQRFSSEPMVSDSLAF